MCARKINEIINADARDILSLVGKNIKFKTTITSPPYFDLKDYGTKGQVGYGQKYKDYLDDLEKIFSDIRTLTHEDGTLWIVIDSFKRNSQLITLPFDLADRLKNAGWFLQNVIIWKKDKTLPWSSGGFVQKKFEYILFFSKNKKFFFNKDTVRNFDTTQLKKWWVKYPERYNPKGKALDDVWEYSIPVQGTWTSGYVRHFCPLPRDMIDRMLQISTNVGDTVLDPFAGSGSVLFQAAIVNRNYIGIELNTEYVSEIKRYFINNLNDAKNKYIKLIDDSSQVDFEQTIIKLRVLKYARLLISKLEIKFDKIKIYADFLKRDKEKIKAKYIFLQEDDEIQNDNEILQYAKILAKNSTFTKFGIDPMFEFGNLGTLRNKKFYLYTKTNTHNFLKNTNNANAVVFSPILLDLKESDYG